MGHSITGNVIDNDDNNDHYKRCDTLFGATNSRYGAAGSPGTPCAESVSRRPSAKEILKTKESQDSAVLKKLLAKIWDGEYHSNAKVAAGAGLTAVATGCTFDVMRQGLTHYDAYEQWEKANPDAFSEGAPEWNIGGGYVFAMLLWIVGLFLLSQVIFKGHDDRLSGILLMTVAGGTGSLGVIMMAVTGSEVFLGVFWFVTVILLIAAFVLRQKEDMGGNVYQVGKHIVGAACLVVGFGVMGDQISYSLHSLDGAGIETTPLVFMFILGAIGLVWISHLLNPFENKGGFVKTAFQSALLPAVFSVGAAGFITWGAQTAGINNPIFSYMMFFAGALCLAVPIALGIMKCRKGNAIVD